MDASEQQRILDRIAAVITPPLERQLGEAYLRGYPFFVRHGPEGVEVEIIPADQFYIDPPIPAAPHSTHEPR